MLISNDGEGHTQQIRGRIWVVDDSALEREMVRRALEERFDLEVFAGGASMLEALAQRPQPDLLMIDWHMPDVSGREICLLVRERTNAAKLPIIILTGSGETLVEGLEAGANDYITKPFRAEELNARASTLVTSRRANEKLFVAEQRLVAEAAFRERFIGILAHDLRQPLHTIQMAANLAELDATPIAASLAARTLRATERMTRMVDELLDFTRSRLDGGMPVTRVDGNLAAIVSGAIRDYGDNGAITFESVGDTRGAWDADRIAQVCSNLIGNAIEYGAKRPIVIRVVGSSSDVVLEVHNEGPAIAAVDLANLFDPYRRGSTTKSTKVHAGLGLGLFIVDQIVRAHGGTTNVRSGVDGTTFILQMPHA